MGLQHDFPTPLFALWAPLEIRTCSWFTFCFLLLPYAHTQFWTFILGAAQFSHSLPEMLAARLLHSHGCRVSATLEVKLTVGTFSPFRCPGSTHLLRTLKRSQSTRLNDMTLAYIWNNYSGPSCVARVCVKTLLALCSGPTWAADANPPCMFAFSQTITIKFLEGRHRQSWHRQCVLCQLTVECVCSRMCVLQ